jgi:plastocyanin
VTGTAHEGVIPGLLPAFTVTRGQATQVALKVATPGIYSLVCTRHAPSMQATVVVLPR